MIRQRRALVLAALAAVAGLAGWRVAAAGDPVVRAQRRDLTLAVDITGVLEAVEPATLGPPQVPNIYRYKIAFMAPEGTAVTAGQPVLGFDASELQQRLQQQLAEAESARTELEKKRSDLAIEAADDQLRLAEAKAALRRAELKTSTPSTLVAALELQKDRLDEQLARKEVASIEQQIAAAAEAGRADLASLSGLSQRAQQKVDELRHGIASMQVKAPRDGIVVYVSNWNGDKKKVGDTCWMTETVIEIPDLAAMRGLGEVEEAHAGKIAAGQPVTLRIDAHPDVEFNGTVGEVSRAVQRRSPRNPAKVVRFQVVLDRTDPERMRPGMRFRGSVETEKVLGILTLPVGAVRATPDGPVVYRHTITGSHAVPVNLGHRNAQYVEVLGGLTEDDAVLASPPALEAGS